jgi:hypothetical protein
MEQMLKTPRSDHQVGSVKKRTKNGVLKTLDERFIFVAIISCLFYIYVLSKNQKLCAMGIAVLAILKVILSQYEFWQANGNPQMQSSTRQTHIERKEANWKCPFPGCWSNNPENYL